MGKPWTGERAWSFGAAFLWASLVLLWGLDITRAGMGVCHLPRLAATLLLAALLVLASALGLRLSTAVRTGGSRRAAALALAALLALALVVRLAGISHEASGRYYADEGTYYHHASKINEGEVLRLSFIYPHLTYYLDAFALWCAGLFPATAARLGAAAGLRDPLSVSWVLLRMVVALLGALTVVPVFFLGRRLAGLPGGCAGAALLIFSPLYNAGSHLNTCDVPSAFFATLCLAAAARLLDGESTRGYVAAGLAAGLAAVSKYPAGLSALAIVAVWLRWRLVRRGRSQGRSLRSLGLLWAALAAIAAFVALMPSLLFFPALAFSGQGMLFGVNQYGKGGWIGVVPRSNSLFYLENLAESFGWPALVAGLVGLALLVLRDRQDRRDRQNRWELFWLAPFPLLYFGLICSMNMVVKRNLYPALPAFAAFLGAGLASLATFAWRSNRADPGPEARRGSPLLAARRAAVALGLLACFALPVWATAEQAAGLILPTTREEAASWMRQNLPPGTRIVKEAYTPDFEPREFAVTENRFAGRFTLEELRDRDNDYLLLASDAFQRFLNPDFTVKPHQREIGERYRAILDRWPPIHEWFPSDFRLGPILKLYRLAPLPEQCTPSQELTAEGAFVPDAAMRPEEGQRIAFFAPGQWALFKGCFPGGVYTLTVHGEGWPAGAASGEVRVLGAAGKAGGEIGRFALRATGPGELSAGPFPLTGTGTGKYLFYLYLPPGATLTMVRVAA
ncbi:MAG TPA: glycosyltransferase family 39 protein [Thermoanaerobaculia bacterium]|nr:glycosyltransferase family 39 protein [Thermoanaerobaculia bacterium]